MSFDSEAIAEQLLETLSGLADFKTTSRRLVHWSEVAQADQPALYVINAGWIPTITQTFAPTVWTMRFDIYLYASAGGSRTKVPASTLNPLVDTIIGALAPGGPLGEQMLSGTVYKCRISGPIETDEGVLGDQGFVIIPISVIIPA